MTPDQFDCIIIGAGQGAALARMLAEAGQRIALVEKGHLGGTCINYGCTPTKARIASAKRAADARQAHDLGVHVTNVEVDLPAIAARSDAIVEDFRQHTARRLDQTAGLEIIHATARFSGPHKVQTTAPDGAIRTLNGRTIVIATGARPKIPKLPGLEKVSYLDYVKVLQLRKVPHHLIVLGGGYIACEYGHMFRRLGARVSIVQSGPQLLDREDPDVAKEISAILRDEGIDIYLDAEATHVESLEDGVKLHLQNGPQLRGSHLLLAVGQTPNTDDLHLEALGVQLTEKGHIPANEYLEVAENLYALGDVKGGPAFTHISFDDARILYARLAEGKRISTQNRLVPYVVFTDPQLGRIGLSEKEAQEAELRYRVAKLPVNDVARGIETGQKHGFLKALVEVGTDRILGGAFICEEGGDIMAILQVAMMGQLPYPVLRDGIFAHPTMAEALNNLFLTMERQEKGIQGVDCIKTSSQ